MALPKHIETFPGPSHLGRFPRDEEGTHTREGELSL